jgi:hypothetical protein
MKAGFLLLRIPEGLVRGWGGAAHSWGCSSSSSSSSSSSAQWRKGAASVAQTLHARRHKEQAGVGRRGGLACMVCSS